MSKIDARFISSLGDTGYHSAGAHNSVYRGKLLTFNSALSAVIRAGTFGDSIIDVYPGDYFEFSDIPYSYVDENDNTQEGIYSGIIRAMDLDYFLHSGDIELTDHHIVVVPDESMFFAGMNSSNTTSGGYAGSKMRTVYLRRAEAIFKACFGEDHILSHREFLVNTVASGKPSDAKWFDSLVELMDEIMLYGSYIFDSGYATGTTIAKRNSIANSQFAAFRHNHSLISIRQEYRLRNVVTANVFASVNSNGCSTNGNATVVSGVRPYSLVY